MHIRHFLASLAHPDFTGLRRNPGFVVVNVLLASLLAVGAERVVLHGGVALIAVALVSLVVRGYVVPGTPMFVDWARRVATPVGPGAELPIPIPMPMQATGDLFRAEVLVREEEDLSVAGSFISVWRGVARSFGPREDDHTAVAQAFGCTPDAVTLRWEQGTLVAECGARPLGMWLSRAAMVADLASVSALRLLVPHWDEMGPQVRRSQLALLRLHIDHCPVCDGTTVLDGAQSRAPGGDGQTLAVTCTGCDARLFESGFDAPVVGGEDTSPPVPGY